MVINEEEKSQLNVEETSQLLEVTRGKKNLSGKKVSFPLTGISRQILRHKAAAPNANGKAAPTPKKNNIDPHIDRAPIKTGTNTRSKEWIYAGEPIHFTLRGTGQDWEPICEPELAAEDGAMLISDSEGEDFAGELPSSEENLQRRVPEENLEEDFFKTIPNNFNATTIPNNNFNATVTWGANNTMNMTNLNYTCANETVAGNPNQWGNMTLANDKFKFPPPATAIMPDKMQAKFHFEPIGGTISAMRPQTNQQFAPATGLLPTSLTNRIVNF